MLFCDNQLLVCCLYQAMKLKMIIADFTLCLSFLVTMDIIRRIDYRHTAGQALHPQEELQICRKITDRRAREMDRVDSIIMKNLYSMQITSYLDKCVADNP